MITFICFYLDQAGHRTAHAGGGVEGGPERGVDGEGKVGGVSSVAGGLNFCGMIPSSDI